MDMKAKISLLVLLLLGLSAFHAAAVTRYVDLNSANPTPPYTSWSTAATNINDAIDSAASNDLILVTNGIYQSGGRVAFGTMMSRVAITKPIVVSSINGPAFTIIQGAFDPASNSTGDNAVQGVYLSNGAVLAGFTITNGATQEQLWELNRDSGGGIWCESTNAFVTNCIILGNTADTSGGGVFSGTIKNSIIAWNTAGGHGGGVSQSLLVNCLLYGNSAKGGGGASFCTVVNSTITANTAYLRVGHGPLGGGIAWCKTYNSIIYYNTNAANGDPNYANYEYSDLTNCCTTPLPSGGFNISNDPLFFDSSNGNLRLQLSSPCIDSGNNIYAPIGSDLEGNQRIINGIVDIGAYESQPPPHVPTILYVDIASTNSVPPYTNWATAATVIQDAAKLASAGDEVLVADGIYKTGGREISGMTNRVVLLAPVRLRSVNGPAKTIIEGFQVPETVFGDSAIRCIYLANGASIVGFTLTGGATQTYNVEHPNDNGIGAGIFCQSISEIVSNCIVVNNKSHGIAGGVNNGTIYSSSISSNSSRYAGGGSFSSILNCCLVRGNSSAYGGGVNGGELLNCLLNKNFAGLNGGGAMNSTLRNCTISDNEAEGIFEGGGGVYACTVKNCIIYSNTAPVFPNHYSVDANYCCTTPAPTSGMGNVTNAPLFVELSGGNLRLQANSPCINAGKNTYDHSATDLDGNSRVVGGTVDIGAYEYLTPSSLLSYAWLQHYGLPTDGSVDFADSDDEGMNNYREWRADTNPTNALSLLRIIGATNGVGGAIVTWESVATRSYTLERSTDLGAASPFQTIATNIAGAVGSQTFTDTSATNSGPYFYRVGVE